MIGFGTARFMEEGEEGPENNLFDNTDVEELSQDQPSCVVNYCISVGARKALLNSHLLRV